MGMNIGAKNYDDPAYQKQLSRLDVVILGFYKGWKPGYGMAKVVRNLKELSGGKILVGQYTILNECQDDPRNAANLDVQTKLNDMDWWASITWEQTSRLTLPRATPKPPIKAKMTGRICSP